MSRQPEVRTRILHLVEKYPGLHLREIQRQAGCSTMLAEYHLNVLEGLGLITSTRHGRYRDFFPVQGERPALDRPRRRWLGLLRRPPILAATLVLLEHGSLRPSALAEELDMAPSTLGYQVKVMRNAGLLVQHPEHGRHTISLAEPETVLSLLRAYHPTPDLMTEYASLWSKVFSRPPAQEPPAENEPVPVENLPAAVRGQSPGVVEVYLALREAPLTQKEIRAATGQPRRTVYSALQYLQREDVVASRTDLRDARQTRYWLRGSDRDGDDGSQANR